MGRIFYQSKNRPLYLINEINNKKDWKNEEKNSNYFGNNSINTNYN